MDTRMHYLTLFKSAASAASGASPAHRTIARTLAEWVLFREYCSSGADLDSLAVRTGCPREEIASFLWTNAGERFFSIRKHLRISDAKDMLAASPELPLSSVAHATGFADKSDFRRAFREETGYAPRFWKENGGSSLKCRVAKILESCRSRCRAGRKTMRRRHTPRCGDACTTPAQ